MRTEFRLWHWPESTVRGEQQELYPTVEAAMDSVPGTVRSEWRESATGGYHLPLPDGNRTGRYQSWAVCPEAIPENDADRIDLAVSIALENGAVDGEHHKMWVIDQMLRALVGDRYEQVITDWCAGEDGPETYSWDEGIAP